MRGALPSSSGETVVYPRSRVLKGDTGILMIRRSDEVFLLAAGSGPLFDELPGEVFDTFKLAPLIETTRRVINRHFPYTLPAPAGRLKSGIGLGDRLGLASPGHIRAVRERGFFPRPCPAEHARTDPYRTDVPDVLTRRALAFCAGAIRKDSGPTAPS